MSTTLTPATFAAELPEITRADIARFVKEGRRRRAEETDKLFRSAGRSIVRLGRAVMALPRRFWAAPPGRCVTAINLHGDRSHDHRTCTLISGNGLARRSATDGRCASFGELTSARSTTWPLAGQTCPRSRAGTPAAPPDRTATSSRQPRDRRSSRHEAPCHLQGGGALSRSSPLLDEPVPPSMGQYSKPHTKAWAAKIASFDGFVFVTPEYNHGISGALKNAIDFLYAEWNNKAAGFVGYGSAGGARAVEQLRLVMGELRWPTCAQQVHALALHRLRELHRRSSRTRTTRSRWTPCSTRSSPGAGR